MDKKAIKTFAIQARHSLIESIQLKLENLGISKDGAAEKMPQSTNEIEYYGDKGLSITGQDICRHRELVARLKGMAKQEEWSDALTDLIEEVAYTWFNRIIAIRFMEVNEYLPSGVRVLSSETKLKVPDILREAFEIEDDLGGYSVDEHEIIQKALDTEDPTDMDAAYVILFTKQANALNQYLPELFEKTDDFMQLLFTPSYSSGVIKDLIDDIKEADFDVDRGGQVEIIGWLYQYYNTEPKDAAFKKKKYLSSDIPAVTQLFTPDWIIKYLVENSLGRYWIRVLHDRGDERTSLQIAQSFNWQYFMSEAKQDEISTRADLSKKRVEDITFVDPAMGSGHILIYAFDVLLQLYQSEGYSRREAAKNIVERNLFGLDIDRRAFQLTYFAMMMKLRRENRRSFELQLHPNVFEVPSTSLKLKDFSGAKDGNTSDSGNLSDVLGRFGAGKELGSLITFKNSIFDDKLINKILSEREAGQLTFEMSDQVHHQWELRNLIRVGKALSSQYTISVTNPPYMGSGKMPKTLAKFVGKYYPASKSDLFAVFIERLQHLTKKDGIFAMITQHQWMFLSSFKDLRERLSSWPIINMAHLGTRAFEEIGGEVVQTTAFVVQKQTFQGFIGTYERLVDFDSQQKKQRAFLAAVQNPNLSYVYRTKQTNFEMIPGQAIAYWASNKSFNLFKGVPVGDVSSPRTGLQTGNNSKFIRNWYEVDISDTNIFNKQEAGTKWFKLNTGGKTVKWYGNYLKLLYWKNKGEQIKKTSSAVIRNESFYFLKGISWKRIGSSEIGFKVLPSNFIFDQSGDALFTKESDLYLLLGFFNSKIVSYLLSFLAPTQNLTAGNISKLPYPRYVNIDKKVSRCIDLAKQSYDSYEHSWNFSFSKLLVHIAEHHRNWTVEAAFKQWQKEADNRFNQLKANEEKLNRIFIDLYGLQDELSPEEEDKDVSVRRANLPRDIKAFISYFIGCVFGRYSIDTPGLAYAGGGWNASKYKTFIPNEDDVILLTDDDYFGDNRDVINRFKEFLTTTFGSENLNENLEFIADNLGKRGDSSEEKIRTYLRDDFFKKDHLSTYQKRPIYWEFSSGRNGGFKALMYLHRYDRNTVAMIRTKYLYPLQETYERKLAQLKKLEENEQQTRQKNKFKKKITAISKELGELIKYDEKLQHVANLHIDLDLDDGVLVNHAKVQADTKILTPLK
ncbi:BREX-1 system adenine-specific DNA-methyltransferase PglX [Lactiplantibacillus plantarum]|uniref:BREX-1 system adenine-specific DNA-methyltransferase PglX n=1 Tax=Lactiplantibacillus plantarum TaxID=1590 RepID=UPI0038545D14|nr:BREX-1 system adenine-specific DNA-methyltransferase PglX [Lactiplantibacillus plantarum]